MPGRGRTSALDVSPRAARGYAPAPCAHAPIRSPSPPTCTRRARP
jgi:hypothetical protein